MDRTVELLRPYQSTRDLDGIRTDREEVQDIAYDGDVCASWKRRHHEAKVGTVLVLEPIA